MHNEDKDVRELLSIQQEQIQKLQYTHRQFRALIYRTIAGLVGCTVLFVMTNVLRGKVSFNEPARYTIPILGITSIDVAWSVHALMSRHGFKTIPTCNVLILRQSH